MANEIVYEYPAATTSGLTTIYATLEQGANYVNASTGELISATGANRPTAAIALSDAVQAYRYVGSVPTGLAASVSPFALKVWQMAGAAAAGGDTFLGSKVLGWNGSQVIPAVNIVQANGTGPIVFVTQPVQFTGGTVNSAAAALDNTTFALNPYYANSITVTLVGVDSTGWTQFDFTAKTNATDADSAALLQIKKTNPSAGSDGLVLLNGAAPSGSTTAADASIIVVSTSPDTVLTIITTARGSAIPAASVLTGSLCEIARYSGDASTKYICGTMQFFLEKRIYSAPVQS